MEHHFRQSGLSGVVVEQHDDAHEGLWFTLAAVSLASWSVMLLSWAHHLLTSQALAAPVMRTAGLGRLKGGTSGRARRVHQTGLPCCSHPCGNYRSSSSVCGCIQAGSVNFYVNYNCSQAKMSYTKADFGRKAGTRGDDGRSSQPFASANGSTSGGGTHRFTASSPQYQDSPRRSDSLTHSASASQVETPESAKYSTFEMVSSSEIQ